MLVDLGSKALIHAYLHEPANVHGVLSLVPVTNSGFSFSALSGHAILTVLLATAALLFCARLLTRVHSKSTVVTISMIIGGGASNLLDRAFHAGRVSDFIGVSTWFVCNVADIAISLGIVLLLVPLCMGRKVLR